LHLERQDATKRASQILDTKYKKEKISSQLSEIIAST
jgi:hypothetical protein